ncbi:MAG: DUF2510 domain-containing protein [Propionicimonas sp.]
MSAPGWYPDPGGQPGMYRFWTGTAWTATITANPAATPPPTSGGPVGRPGGQPGQPGGDRRRLSLGWVAGGLAALVALGLIVWLVTQGIGRLSNGEDPFPTGGQASQNVCPKVDSTQETTAPAQRNDGRVHGGKLSYPMLGDPWGSVQGDNRVPFGRDVAEQIVMVEPNYDGLGANWVASVLVGELVAGDGFFSPQEGSQIVMKCVVGEFYGDAVVQRDDKVSKATTVDGHDAWLVESHLSFDIAGLQTKGELAIVVIVDTGADSASLYYASIPDTVPELVDDARSVLKQLTVDS